MSTKTAESPATVSEPALAGSARERLLAAADELFYNEGIHTVGIDRVIERAGVAKASLYNAYGSKDELIKAYLQGRHARTERRINAALEQYSSPRDKLLGIFIAQGELYASSQFRGCAFINASAESPAGGSVEQASDEYRDWLRELFRGLAADAGAADPSVLAGQLVLIYDGSAMSTRMDRDPSVFASGQQIAALLIDNACA
jgi:AcrR family transcriptional regulator